MVSTEVISVSNCKKELKISVPAEKVARLREEQFNLVRKDADIQGFRKGRAPKHLVQKQFQGAIERYTLDEALQYGYEEGLKDSKLIPLSDPVVKKFDFDDDKNLLMEVEVETYPEIELKKYTGIKIEKDVFKISSEDVDYSIDYIRKQKAVITPIEDKAQAGYYVSVTMQEIDEAGLPIVGKKYDDIRFQIGDGKFDKDIEMQLIGLGPGEEKVVEKKYDKDVQQKNLAGKTERYMATVKKIEHEELPELSVDFIKELNFEGVDTIEKLKDQVKQNMETQWGQESEQRFYNKFVQELLQLNPFEVPDSVVERYLDQMVEDIKNRDKKVDEEAVRKNYRVDALFNIKWFYLKEKISQTENIKAEEEDFSKYLASVDDDNIKKMYTETPELKKRIMSDIYEKKVFDFLVENSKITIAEKPIRKDMGAE